MVKESIIHISEDVTLPKVSLRCLHPWCPWLSKFKFSKKSDDHAHFRSVDGTTEASMAAFPTWFPIDIYRRIYVYGVPMETGKYERHNVTDVHDLSVFVKSPRFLPHITILQPAAQRCKAYFT